MFNQMREQQAANRDLFGNGYNTDDSAYIFVDILGNLIDPDYISRKYTRLRDKYGLPHVTLHELRHTVATLMVKHKVPMKYVQSYLGHSDFSTTANYYAHVYNDEAKGEMANLMSGILNGTKDSNDVSGKDDNGNPENENNKKTPPHDEVS